VVVVGAAAVGVAAAAYYHPCFRDELRLTSLRLRLLTIIVFIAK